MCLWGNLALTEKLWVSEFGGEEHLKLEVKDLVPSRKTEHYLQEIVNGLNFYLFVVSLPPLARLAGTFVRLPKGKACSGFKTCKRELDRGREFYRR